jgi:quercetin dioxygenase-like cupin family protein
MSNNIAATQEQKMANEGFKPAPVDYFTGKAWVKSLVIPDEHTNCTVSDVLFEPGTRNNWHTHPSNQILIVKEGVCYYQEEGQPRRRMAVGEVVNILPGIKHWHGASPDSRMIHIAININSEKGTVTWLEPVTDEQYAG